MLETQGERRQRIHNEGQAEGSKANDLNMMGDLLVGLKGLLPDGDAYIEGWDEGRKKPHITSSIPDDDEQPEIDEDEIRGELDDFISEGTPMRPSFRYAAVRHLMSEGIVDHEGIPDEDLRMALALYTRGGDSSDSDTYSSSGSGSSHQASIGESLFLGLTTVYGISVLAMTVYIIVGAAIDPDIHPVVILWSRTDMPLLNFLLNAYLLLVAAVAYILAIGLGLVFAAIALVVCLVVLIIGWAAPIIWDLLS